MAFRFSQREIKNVTDLLRCLADHEGKLMRTAAQGSSRKPRLWFRGLGDKNYGLIPTYHRRGLTIGDEIFMMNLFKQNAHEFLDMVPTREWEWMFLTRHHGLPSRLLDWTESPLIALFFAVSEEEPDKHAMDDGRLWCLLPTKLNQLALHWPPTSDFLPMFTSDEAEYSLGENEALLNYLPSSMVALVPGSPSPPSVPPAAGISVRTTRRIQAQLGVFTIHHVDGTPLESVGDGSHIWRYRIPAGRKQAILQELTRLGITRRMVFPDLDNVAREAMDSVGGH